MEHIIETDVIQCWPANNDSVCKQEHLRLTQKYAAMVCICLQLRFRQAIKLVVSIRITKKEL